MARCSHGAFPIWHASHTRRLPNMACSSHGAFLIWQGPRGSSAPSCSARRWHCRSARGCRRSRRTRCGA
eukprot:6549176-Prymnesium_polylepis.1